MHVRPYKTSVVIDVFKKYQRSSREDGFQQEIVQKIIRHELYDPDVIYADIALLLLRNHWILTEYVKPVCLPESSFSVSDGAVCAVTGWGDTDGDATVLNQATIPVHRYKT